MKRFTCHLIVTMLSLILITTSFSGCNGSTDSRPAVEINGTVTLDGDPLQEGSIQFSSPKTGESAYANLDANGHYSISFPQADIGTEYEIIVNPPVVEEENAMALAEKPKAKSTMKIPAKYSNRTTSGLKAKIQQAGSNEANFELKSK